jgi:hypothetical protein
MWIVPEGRSAILHTCGMAAIAAICVAGVIRVRKGWGRVLLLVVAVAFALLTAFGLYITDLILKYGPR